MFTTYFNMLQHYSLPTHTAYFAFCTILTVNSDVFLNGVNLLIPVAEK
jgi:hypothetical protein